MSVARLRVWGCRGRLCIVEWSVLACARSAVHDGRMRFSLEGKLAALFATIVFASAGCTLLLARSFDSSYLVLLAIMLAAVLPIIWLARRTVRPVIGRP